jgi:hypothetical protein
MLSASFLVIPDNMIMSMPMTHRHDYQLPYLRRIGKAVERDQ